MLATGHGAVAPTGALTSSSPAAAQAETIHATANHPWLTADRGWVQAGALRPGEAVVTLNGATGTVAWVHVVPGQADMYNLTVANDHTYAVGDDRWVVHNCGSASDPYEDRVKQANGDPTVGENNSHRWDGSQPVKDLNGNPVDRGWSGPDAVRDYGGPNETWIEAKSNIQPGQEIFNNPRNLRQLGTYERYGTPFEYWLDNERSQLSRELIEIGGGRLIIFQ